MSILEGCRHNKVAHWVYASSSSVYGSNTKIPFSKHDNTDHSVNLYAAIKKSNELMAHTYSLLCGLPTTGLRFFTFYDPWGRPDMAPKIFSKAIMEGTPIDVLNHGDMKRGFSYIDDIVEGVVRVSEKTLTADPKFDTANPDPSSSNVPYRLYIIGNHKPVGLLEFIETMENTLGKKAIKNMKPMQAGDVQQTYVETSDLRGAVEFAPTTVINAGIGPFITWAIKHWAI